MTVDAKTQEFHRARWYVSLLKQALEETQDLQEAMLAVDVALQVQPLPAGDPPAPVPPPVPTAQPPSHPTTPSVFLAHDIFNKRAQGILNRAVEASKKLSSQARADLRSALALDSPPAMAQAVVTFVQRYRFQLAELLGATQLAALLAGAREVAAQLPPLPPVGVAPPLPPTLPPAEATRLLASLRAVPQAQREQALYQLPAAQQEYVRAVLAAEAALPPRRPPVLPPAPPVDSPEREQWPIIEEAVRELSEKNLVTRDSFDQLDAAARAKAFTVAGVDAQETLGKIRDALAENVAESVDLEAFRGKVLSQVEPGTFLSDSHLDVVFRNGIQAAFSDGQMKVLSHPVVRPGFPYAKYSSIVDERRRDEHGQLEHLGIGGTAVYRIDDPVFKTFRPPWDHNDRCSWIPLTVRQAAEQGVSEAISWLASGVEPSPPAFVPMPPFQPPPGFQRSLQTAPLSVRLSMDSLERWDGAFFAEWQRVGQVGTTQDGKPIYRWWNPETQEGRNQHIAPGTRQGAAPGSQPTPRQAAPPPAARSAPATPARTPARPVHPAEAIAAHLQKGSAGEALAAWRAVPPEQRAEVAGRLTPEARQAIHKAAQQAARQPETAPKPAATASAQKTPPAVSKLPPREEIQQGKRQVLQKSSDAMGGTEETVKIVTDKGTFFAKRSRADRAAIESVMSALGKVAGVNLPEVQVVQLSLGEGGRSQSPFVVSEWVDGTPLFQLGDFRAAVRKMPRAEVDRQILFDYLSGSGDRHAGNYMISNGKLASIDHESGLFPSDRLSALSEEGMTTNVLLETVARRADPYDGTWDYSIDPREVKNMAERGAEMLNVLKSRLDEIAERRDEAGRHSPQQLVAGMEARLKKLQVLAQQPQPNLADLG